MYQYGIYFHVIESDLNKETSLVTKRREAEQAKARKPMSVNGDSYSNAKSTTSGYFS